MNEKIESNTSTITVSFTLVSQCGFMVLLLMFLHLFWIKNANVLKLLNAIKTNSNTKLPNQPKWLIVGERFLVGFLLVGFGNIGWLPALIGRYNKRVNYTISSFYSADSGEELLYAISKTAFEAYFYNFCSVPMTFLSILSVTFLKKAKELRYTLRNNARHGMAEILNLKQEVKLVNRIIGNQVLAFGIAYLSYYCKLPEVMMSDCFTDSPSVITFYFLTSMVIWLMFAEFQFQVNGAISNWCETILVMENNVLKQAKSIELFGFHNCNPLCLGHAQCSKISMDVQTLQAVLNIEGCGLSCRFFTVSYSLLGSVCQLFIFVWRMTDNEYKMIELFLLF